MVGYPSVTVIGGAAPVAISCTPPSGSMFPVASTTVSCVATDARQRIDSCSFSVTVRPPVRSSATTFTAFGDSITEGLSFAPLLIPSPPGSYPAILQSLLSSRYTAQTIVVYDEGVGGRKVVDDLKDLTRLRTALAAEHPDALLLFEGANDLNELGAAGIAGVVTGLQTMIREGRSRAATVFVATLLPQRPGGQRAYAPALIAPTNDQIRAMATAEAATLVDLYAAFGGVAGALIGDDGLHPNADGKQKIAETFFDAIRSRLEIPPSSPLRSRQ